jgi:transcriptional regulator with XRE-family HTH domain
MEAKVDRPTPRRAACLKTSREQSAISEYERLAKADRTDEPISEWLPRLAAERGYSFRRLADEIGVEQSYLSRIKGDDPSEPQWRPPSMRVLERLAGALGVEADYFPEYRCGVIEETIRADAQLRNRFYDAIMRRRSG